MKTKLLNSLAALALLCAVVGCQTPPKAVAFNTLASVKTGVTKSMEAATELHFYHHVTDKEFSDLQGVYDAKFVPAFQTAVDLAKQDYTKLSPANVTGLATEIFNTVESWKKR